MQNEAEGFFTSAVQARVAGRGAEAERLSRMAASAAKTDAARIQALLLLGVVLSERGAFDEAERAFRAVLGIDAGCCDALTWLATLLRFKGQPQEAIELCLRAVAVQPDNADAHLLLGLCYLLRLRGPNAVDSLRRTIELQPNQMVAHKDRALSVYHFLGLALRLSGLDDEAEQAFEAAVTRNPAVPDSSVMLGQMALKSGRRPAAKAYFNRALETAAGSWERLESLAVEFAGEGNDAKAAECLRQAVELNPRVDRPYLSLASRLVALGRFDEAIVTLERVLARQPRSTGAYLGLTLARKTVEAHRPLVARMRALLDGAGLAPTERMNLHYALGRSLDDLKAYADAMPHFDAANRHALELYQGDPFDRDEIRADTDQKLSLYSAEFLNRHRALGCADETPILIVGMIRSGTTLIEQILANHPDVGAGGELPFLLMRTKEVAPDGEPDLQAVADLQRDYLRLLRTMEPDKPRVTDKLPMNYRTLGAVNLLFPNARIIHCRRNPIDTCLSIYVTPFDRPLAFGHDRGSIRFFYSEYLRYMAHWRSVLPADRFFEVDYEDVVTHPETSIRAMLDFCGLPWSELCLRHGSSTNTIRTPSAWQARQPVYTSAVQRWRNYEPWVGEFLDLTSTEDVAGTADPGA